MSLMKAAIFFITGASGVGKTTLVEQLKLRNIPSCIIYDFDERGVPSNADKAWRKRETELWLDVAVKNLEKNISTVICGVSVPSEILETRNTSRVFFGLIKVDVSIMTTRLLNRGWSSDQVRDNILWSNVLEQEVIAFTRSKVVDASTLDPSNVCDIFAAWIVLVVEKI